MKNKENFTYPKTALICLNFSFVIPKYNTEINIIDKSLLTYISVI